LISCAPDSGSRHKEFVKRLDRREQVRYGPLRRLVQPYILRRLKTDISIIADLRDKPRKTLRTDQEAGGLMLGQSRILPVHSTGWMA
jgi:SNF2 family DNA or RNA helicase